jgi:hypothetical protein
MNKDFHGGDAMKKSIVLGCLVLLFVSLSWAQEKCEAPVWNKGDQWTFKRADGSTFTNKVVEVKTDLFVVKAGQDPDLYAYDRATMNVSLMIKADGRQMKATDDLRKLFNFPIFVGKKWTDTNSRQAGGVQQQRETTFLIDFNVEGIEDLATDAGTFKTYRIRHKLTMMRANNPSGWLLFWYSPDAKWWVKREVEKSNFWKNFQNIELVSYELK